MDGDINGCMDWDGFFGVDDGDGDDVEQRKISIVREKERVELVELEKTRVKRTKRTNGKSGKWQAFLQNQEESMTSANFFLHTHTQQPPFYPGGSIF